MSKVKSLLEKRSLMIAFLLGAALTAAGLVVYFSAFYKPSPPTIPSYLPEVHSQAIENTPSEGENFDKMDVPNGGGGAMVICGAEAIVHLDDKAVNYYYSNPNRSASAVVIQLSVDNQVIAQSGSLLPGHKTYSLALEKSASLSKGTYPGILKIYFYDLESKEKAMVDSKVEVTVTVVD